MDMDNVFEPIPSCAFCKKRFCCISLQKLIGAALVACMNKSNFANFSISDIKIFWAWFFLKSLDILIIIQIDVFFQSIIVVN